jgi:hypothetical protein
MNPERILCALDHHLVKPVHLILYGRAALALGFPPPRPEFAMTLDVDVSAIESAVVPDISEIREAFETNAAWLREQIPLL